MVGLASTLYGKHEYCVFVGKPGNYSGNRLRHVVLMKGARRKVPVVEHVTFGKAFLGENLWFWLFYYKRKRIVPKSPLNPRYSPESSKFFDGAKRHGNNMESDSAAETAIREPERIYAGVVQEFDRFRKLVKDIKNRRVPHDSPYTKELAHRALAAISRREAEGVDVGAWAKRLVRDIGNAND